MRVRWTPLRGLLWFAVCLAAGFYVTKLASEWSSPQWLMM